MKELLIFFQKEPQEVAQLSSLRLLVLQAFFVSKNIYRYHQDFFYRWRLVFEQSLIRDILFFLTHDSDMTEEILSGLKQNAAVHAFDSSEKGLQDFLAVQHEQFFFDMSFFDILQYQISMLPQEYQSDIYALTQAYLAFYIEKFQQTDDLEKNCWLCFRSFFIDEKGELTAFFRTLVAKLVYPESRIKKALSLGEIGAAASKKKKIPSRGLSDLKNRLEKDLDLLRSSLQKIIAHSLPEQAINDSLESLRHYFDVSYGIGLSHHSTLQSHLIGLMRMDKSDILWISLSDFKYQAIRDKIFDTMLDWYLEATIAGKIIAFYQEPPIKSSEYLCAINEDSDDQESDYDDSFIQKSRSLSDDPSYAGYKKSQSRLEQTPWSEELIDRVVRHYYWPSDFIKIILTDRREKPKAIHPSDAHLLSQQQWEFQWQVFTRLQKKWMKVFFRRVSSCYGARHGIFPFIHDNLRPGSSMDLFLSKMISHNIFLNPISQRYRDLDSQCLHAVLKRQPCPPELIELLIEEAFDRSALEILKIVVKPQAVMKRSWGPLVQKSLERQDFDLVDYFLSVAGESLIEQDWVLLSHWVLERLDSCAVTELKVMTLISQKFSQVVQQTAYREFFMAELLTKPELIEQGLQFCIYWGYPQDNADLTLFQKITLEQKAAHYQRWLQSLGRGNTEYQEIWHHMSLLEKDPLTRLIATLCQQLGSTIERPMIQQVSPCMQEYTTLEKLMGLIQNLLDSCPQTQPIAIQLREEERRHPGFIAELTHKSSFSEMLEALVSYYHSNIICQKYPSSMIFSDRTQKPLGQRQQKSGLC